MAPFNHTSRLPEREAEHPSVPVKTEACHDPGPTGPVPDRDATLVHILDPISECVLNVQLLSTVTVVTPQPHVRVPAYFRLQRHSFCHISVYMSGERPLLAAPCINLRPAQTCLVSTFRIFVCRYKNQTCVVHL